MALTTAALRVETAWTTTTALSSSPAWEDMTPFLALEESVAWNRGRPDVQSLVAPGILTYALRNDAGDFTPGRSAASRYPNIVMGRRTRVTVRPVGGASGNLLPAEDASFEGGTTGSWSATPVGYTAVTIANVTTAAQDGTHSLQVTWPTASGGAAAVAVTVAGMVIGRTYTLSAYVNVTASGPAVQLLQGYGAFSTAPATGFSDTTSTTGSFQRIAITFTPNTNSAPFILKNVTASTAGQTFLLDAVMVDEGTTVGTFTTAAPPITVRFDGPINQLEVAMSDHGAVTKVTATDLLKQLGSNAPFASQLSEEILYDAPLGYWPMGESAGSSAGDISGNTSVPPLVATQLGSGGTLAFGTGTGPGFDGQAAPVLTPVNVTNGLYLAASSLNFPTPYAVTLEAFLNTSTAASQVIARVVDAYGSYLSLEVTAASKLLCTWFSAGVGTAGTVTSANNVTGGTKHVAVTVSLSGTTATMILWLDGTNAGSTTFTFSSGLLTTWTQMLVGGTSAGQLLTGTVAHAAVTASALSSQRISDHRNAGITGFLSELSGARVSRLLRVAGFPTALTNVETGLSTMAPQSINGQAPLSALQDVQQAERGLIFAAGDGRVTFHGRSHRYNAPAAATFDAGADLGPSDLSQTLNDQLLINDVTGTRPNGATQRAVDQNSVNINGTYSTSLSILVDSDSLAQSLLQSIANAYSIPAPRSPELILDLLTITDAQAAAALALDLGARADVTNLPTQAAASSLSLFVEGVAETVTINGWQVKFTTGPATYTAAWVLDSPTYSQLDSTTVLTV